MSGNIFAKQTSTAKFWRFSSAKNSTEILLFVIFYSASFIAYFTNSFPIIMQYCIFIGHQ